jgi:hypothetical protein
LDFQQDYQLVRQEHYQLSILLWLAEVDREAAAALVMLVALAVPADLEPEQFLCHPEPIRLL